MWLLILLLSLAPGQGKVQQIEAYETQAQCVEAQQLITREFEKSYPGDHTFALQWRATAGTLRNQKIYNRTLAVVDLGL